MWFIAFLFCKLITETQMHKSVLLIAGSNFKIQQGIDGRYYVKEWSAQISANTGYLLGMRLHVHLPRPKPTDIFTHSAHLNIINDSKNITNTLQNNQERSQGDFSFLCLTGSLTSFKLLGKFEYHQKIPLCLLFYSLFRIFKKQSKWKTPTTNKKVPNPQNHTQNPTVLLGS